MPDSDLMFRPALELAALVRAGELSRARARRASRWSGSRSSTPRSNAFVQVDAERRARRRRARSAPATSGRSRACRSRSRTTAPCSGLRLTQRLLADGATSSPDYDHNVDAPPAATPGFVIVGTTTLPEYGILPTTEARAVRADAQPVGSRAHARAAPPAARPRRSPRAWCRSRTATTAAARSGSRRLLRPGRAEAAARAHLAGARLGDSSLVIDGMLTRTVADTAAILDVLAGYEPGDATWAPPPAEPFAAAAARDARPAADRRHDAAADRRRRRRPVCARRRRPTPPSCCARSGTRSRRSSRRGGARARRAVRHGLLRPTSRSSIAYSGHRRRRASRRAEDMEPMSWAIFSMVASSWTRSSSCAADRAAAGVRTRRLVAFLEPYDALLTPALAERRCRSARSTPPRPTRWRRSRARACSRRSRRSSTPPASRRSRCRCSTARTACRWRCSSSGGRRGEGDAAGARRAARSGAAVGRARPGARRADGGAARRPSTGGHRPRRRRRARSASAAPRAEIIETSISSASSQVANARAPGDALEQAAARARRAASARARAGGGGSSERSTARTISLWLSVSGPASS